MSSPASLSASTRATNAAEKYVALVLDKSIYLFKKNDINSFESLVDVNTEIKESSSLGAINVSGHKVPVYCLEDDLSVMKSIPASRTVCVAFKGLKFALLCKDIRVLDYNEMNEYDLPECMLHQYMPISKICIYKSSSSHDDKIAMLVSGEALEKHITKSIRY